jgi:hypothetical protein
MPFICIGGVMVQMLPMSMGYLGFLSPIRVKLKSFNIGICCFSTKHVALMSKRKDWLDLDQDNVSEWSNMSDRRLLFQWTSTIKHQLSLLD